MGTFARRSEREKEALWLFLDISRVDPTSNAAEGGHRFAVLWRKWSHGTGSEQGNWWMERRLSFRQTCRVQGRSTFALLGDAVTCLFKGEKPNLKWMPYHKPPLAHATR